MQCFNMWRLYIQPIMWHQNAYSGRAPVTMALRGITNQDPCSLNGRTSVKLQNLSWYKTGFAPVLNLPHQNRLCADHKPAFSFWINILTVSDVMCDSQGLGLVARIEASILVFDTMQVLYWHVLRQIQFCSFDRRCKTCLDTKPVLYQDRFCSLTDVLPLSEQRPSYPFKA